MKKKNIKKVLKLFSEIESSSMKVEHVTRNSKLSNNEVIEIFDFLIAFDYVIDASSNDGRSILKRTDVDYSEMSKLPDSIKQSFQTTITHKQIVVILMMLGIIISIIVGWEKILEFFKNR